MGDAERQEEERERAEFKARIEEAAEEYKEALRRLAEGPEAPEDDLRKRGLI